MRGYDEPTGGEGTYRGFLRCGIREISTQYRARGAPHDPIHRLYSARVVRHTTADVRTGGPKRQSSRQAEHIPPYPKLRSHSKETHAMPNPDHLGS